MTYRESLRKACIMGNFHISKEDYEKLSEEDKEKLVEIGRMLSYPNCDIKPKEEQESTETIHGAYI